MNGKDLIQHIKAHPKELQYWEVVARLMQLALARKGEKVIVQNLRNTHGTGIDGIEDTIAHLEADGFFVKITQEVKRPVQTTYGTIEVLDYATVTISYEPLPETKFMGTITDPEIDQPLPNQTAVLNNKPILG